MSLLIYLPTTMTSTELSTTPHEVYLESVSINYVNGYTPAAMPAIPLPSVGMDPSTMIDVSDDRPEEQFHKPIAMLQIDHDFARHLTASPHDTFAKKMRFDQIPLVSNGKTELVLIAEAIGAIDPAMNPGFTPNPNGTACWMVINYRGSRPLASPVGPGPVHGTAYVIQQTKGADGNWNFVDMSPGMADKIMDVAVKILADRV